MITESPVETAAAYADELVFAPAAESAGESIDESVVESVAAHAAEIFAALVGRVVAEPAGEMLSDNNGDSNTADVEGQEISGPASDATPSQEESKDQEENVTADSHGSPSKKRLRHCCCSCRRVCCHVCCCLCQHASCG